MSRRSSDQRSAFQIDEAAVFWRPSPNGTVVDQAYLGTSGNDKIRGTSGDDYIDVSQGGDDIVSSGKGWDKIYFGSAFTEADRVNGGSRYAQVILEGDYSAGIRLENENFQHIINLTISGGSYYIDGDVFPGQYQYILIDGSTLAASQAAELHVACVNGLDLRGGAGNDILDASGSGHGAILYGNAGNDILTGGRGGTNFFGGDGADVLINGRGRSRFWGEGGADIIDVKGHSSSVIYYASSDSTETEFDLIKNFKGVIDLSFDSDTTKAGEQGTFHLGVTPSRVGDLTVSYDEVLQQTIIRAFTDQDDVADCVTHIDGDVSLALQHGNQLTLIGG